MNIKYINIYNKLEAGNFKSKMILQVHDELVFDIYKPELEELTTLIKTEMENAYKLEIKIYINH